MSAAEDTSPVDESLLGIVDFPSVRRGYAPANVQAFVSAAHAEMRRLAGENRRLQMRVDELEADLRARPVEAAPAPQAAVPTVAASPLDEWSQRTAELLAGARADIDKLMVAARRQADDIVAEATREAAGIREQAEQEAALRLARSDDQRSRILADAIDEQDRAALAVQHAHAELARVDRQRESIAASLRTLQTALQQTVDTIERPSAALPVELPAHEPSSVVALDDHRTPARDAS